MAWYNRNKKSVPETKSYSYSPNIFEYLSQTGWGQVTAFQSLRYYEQISPVSIGVDKVVDEFKALQPAIFDKSDQEYTTSHDFLTFLSRPNASISGQDFFKSYGTYYEVTGQVYLMATGNPNRPPLELFIIPPQFVEIRMDSDGFPLSYQVNSGSNVGSIAFTRKEIDGRFRYFNNDDRELWYVKDFNPNASSTNFYGASRLNSIYYEIEQHLSSSRHNLSLLKRGGRLSGAVKIDGVLEDDQFERLKEQVAKTIAGADNAGHIPLLEAGADFVEMGKSNKDMDFAELKREIKEVIFTRLDIPVPLISSASMTMNNYQVANIALYDGAVIPLSSKLYGELTLFLGPRFGLSEDEILSCDPATIPALQSRRLTTLLMQNKLYILSDNEQRAQLGREGYTGGDAIYKPGTLIPAGTDSDTSGNRDKPATRTKFINICREQKDIKGVRLYTDKQIEEFADEEELVD